MIIEKVVFGTITVLDLIQVTGIVLVAVLLTKVLSLYTRRFFRERMGKDSLEILIKIIAFAVLAIAFVSILSVLGLNLSGLLVAGGIAGIVIGFASQSIVGNLISGLFLMAERPVKIGDIVNIDGQMGIVEDIHIISTTLRAFDGLFIRVPNEKVFTNQIINYVSHEARRFEYIVGIPYSDDADKAIEIIKEVIDRNPFALKEPLPHIFVDTLGDNSVNIIVRIWAPVAVWYDVKMELLWKIKAALEAEGIHVPFPQRTVWFADGAFDQQKKPEEG